MISYQCGTCDSHVLTITAHHDRWEMECGNGHKMVPIPGNVWTVDTTPEWLRDRVAGPIYGHTDAELPIFKPLSAPGGTEKP